MIARNQASSNRLACLLLALWAMLVGVQPAFADDPPLSLTIRAMATEVVVGEPVVLEVTLRNEGDETVQVEHWLQQHGNLTASYYITGKGDAEPRRLVSGTYRDWQPPAKPLEPKQEIRHVEWLHFDLDAGTTEQGNYHLVTGELGHYALHVEFHSTNNDLNQHLVLRSNLVNVTVSEAKTEWSESRSIMASPEVAVWIDSGMPRMWGSPRAKLGSYGHVPASQRRNEQLEQIAASGSPYAMYASLLQGGYELSSFHYDGTVEERIAADEARSHRALKYLELADKEGFPLRSEVVWHMRETAVLLGDHEAVEGLTNRLETDFSHSHAAKRPIQSVRYNRGWR